MLIEGREYNPRSFSRVTGEPIRDDELPMYITFFNNAWYRLFVAFGDGEDIPEKKPTIRKKFTDTYKQYRDAYVKLRQQGIIVGAERQYYGQSWRETGEQVTLLGVQSALADHIRTTHGDLSEVPALATDIRRMMDEAHLVLDPTQDTFGYSVPDYWATVMHSILTTDVGQTPRYKTSVEMAFRKVALDVRIDYQPPTDDQPQWNAYHQAMIESILAQLKASPTPERAKLLTSSLSQLQKFPGKQHISYHEFSLISSKSSSYLEASATWIAMKAAYLSGNRETAQQLLAVVLNQKGYADTPLEQIPDITHFGTHIREVITFAHDITFPSVATADPTA